VTGPVPWGFCPECGKRLALRKDGTVRSHKVQALFELIPCPGVGQIALVRR